MREREFTKAAGAGLTPIESFSLIVDLHDWRSRGSGVLWKPPKGGSHHFVPGRRDNGHDASRVAPHLPADTSAPLFYLTATCGVALYIAQEGRISVCSGYDASATLASASVGRLCVCVCVCVCLY